MLEWRPARQRIETEELDGGVIVARFVTNELGLFGRDDAPEFIELVKRADRDPNVRAVVFTGSHPGRFISHAGRSCCCPRSSPTSTESGRFLMP